MVQVGRQLLFVVAGLAVYSSGLVSAHDPVVEAEGAGWWDPGLFPGLESAVFLGPPGTAIESLPCGNARDEPILSQHSNHVGHIASMANLRAPPAADGVVPGSIDLWHFGMGNGFAEDRVNLEGPSSEQTGVILGLDGYVRLQLMTPLTEAPGPDFVLYDVHTNMVYCVYGAIHPEGPFMFIGSTSGSGAAYLYEDLGDSYSSLFSQEYAGAPRAEWLLIIASQFRDGFQHTGPQLEPAFLVPFACQGQDVYFYDASVAEFYAYTRQWDLGDGQQDPGDSPVAVARYPAVGTYTVRLTVEAPQYGVEARSVEHQVEVRPSDEPPCRILPNEDGGHGAGADDLDRDGVQDDADNCVSRVNRDQADTDNDEVGDACERPVGSASQAPATEPSDVDRDGVQDAADNCVIVKNRDQVDMDGDGKGDACDPDGDGDGVDELVAGWAVDNCPGVSNAQQEDADLDWVGDACDSTMGLACDGGCEPSKSTRQALVAKAPPTYDLLLLIIGFGVLGLGVGAMVFMFLGRRK